ncbi:MAG: hypothetical protein WDZ60_03945, partial [Wenzhouxiangellaceae bacterium]
MANSPRKTARSQSLYDRLSRLTYEDACKLLGAAGKRLLSEGGKLEIDAPAQVELTPTVFRLRLPGLNGDEAVVTIQVDKERRQGLAVQCRGGRNPGVARGAALAFILEEKQYLGLASMPNQDQPFELLDDPELEEWALRERVKRAETEPMDIKALDSSTPWTDYVVTSRLSGKTYRVALRGMGRGDSYCNCADFRANTLGACKHVIKVQGAVRKKFSARRLRDAYIHEGFAVAVSYVKKPCLRLLTPDSESGLSTRSISRLAGRDLESSKDIHSLLKFLAEAQQNQVEVRIYPD